ncbi:hypothetical protein AN189_17585 [Loktanella sp. 3ANDIMAR09]|nr:hypothetical protein AN189_17585 [Loktanella sp. 3ANDIMAR09]
MAQRGGKRAGAGRKPGQVSKAKRDLAEMAKDHAQSALNVLVEIMTNDQEAATARVSAANGILDRAYGKAVPMQVDPQQDDAPSVTVNLTMAAPVKDIRVTRSDG